mmetsp:Transcript_45433/g.137726  ORF Transcript_45433/g.137726 Transcript_45433/m.137726 type:complete len:237 (-) Transcript_45433:518-1228(-)
MPLPTITSAARGWVARFTTRATRSLPTRASGKWTTSCSSMIMPSRWYAMIDLHRSSMEKWYKSRSTMCRKGGFRKRSTKSLTMPDSMRELRRASSNEKLNKTRKASNAILTFSWLAKCTSRVNVSGLLMRSLLSSKTLSFFIKPNAASSKSSWPRSSNCVRSSGIFRFTIFFSVVISSARFNNAIKHTWINLLCRLSWIRYFFSSLRSKRLSSAVAVSPNSWKRILRRSMSPLRTW